MRGIHKLWSESVFMDGPDKPGHDDGGVAKQAH